MQHLSVLRHEDDEQGSDDDDRDGLWGEHARLPPDFDSDIGSYTACYYNHIGKLALEPGQFAGLISRR